MDINKFKFHTYKSITGTPVVVAISTYAGKSVKGRAKCAPSDGYDIEKGKKLAAARCAEKVANKRMKRAEQKHEEALIKFEQARRNLHKMSDYSKNSQLAYMKAKDETEEILKTM